MSLTLFVVPGFAILGMCLGGFMLRRVRRSGAWLIASIILFLLGVMIHGMRVYHPPLRLAFAGLFVGYGVIGVLYGLCVLTPKLQPIWKKAVVAVFGVPLVLIGFFVLWSATSVLPMLLISLPFSIQKSRYENMEWAIIVKFNVTQYRRTHDYVPTEEQLAEFIKSDGDNWRYVESHISQYHFITNDAFAIRYDDSLAEVYLYVSPDIRNVQRVDLKPGGDYVDEVIQTYKELKTHADKLAAYRKKREALSDRSVNGADK